MVSRGHKSTVYRPSSTVSRGGADRPQLGLFYLLVAGAAALVYWPTFRTYGLGLSTPVGLEVLRHVVDVARFGRAAAYHMWSAKAWGLSLFAACAELFATGGDGFFFVVTVLLGLVTNLEGLLASLVLPTWQHDVPSLYHAVQRRRTGVGA